MEGLVADLWDSFERLEQRKRRIIKLLGHPVTDRAEEKEKLPRLPRIAFRPVQPGKIETSTTRLD
jgi:hypothetical protein